ncbi:MAG TPA: DUF1559 domain-containing protein [Gemmataceae bacterium]|nr:DUF1559 domain-containing protein [Gemmataceae bacterium]
MSSSRRVRRADYTLPESAAVSLPLPPACDNAPDFVRATTSKKAVAGLVFGLLSFLLGVLASVPAFVYAARGLTEINRDPAHVKGRGLALAGIFAAGLGLFLQPVLLLFVVEVVRDWVIRKTDAANLQRIGEAMYAYDDGRGRFPDGHLPPAVLRSPNGQPLLSWRVALLPYLGERGLYEQFHLDEPWDSPHNFALVGRMPKVYGHPADLDAAAQGLTYYRVVIGGDCPFRAPDGPIIAHFINGISKTFLVVEATDPVPWTKPDELRYDPGGPVPKLGGLLRGGCNVLYADRTVRFLRDDVSESKVREGCGEILGTEW